MAIKLYSSSLSANGRKALIVNALLELACEIIETNVYAGAGQAPDYLAINPLGKIPALVDDDYVLTESNAIMIYLAKLANSDLFPNDIKQEASIHAWLFWEAAHFQPTVSSTIGEHVGYILVPQYVAKPEEAIDWSNSDFVTCMNKLESTLSDGNFLLGDTITLADVGVSAMMMYFSSVGYDWQNYSLTQRWFNRLNNLPAWQKTASPLWQV